MRKQRAGVFCLVLAIVAACAPARPPAAFDPVTMDPPAGDPPASMDGLHFSSAGANLNGVIYEAAGPGPHPTLLMMHGFPGSEQNRDIAQVVRRAGWNAVIFHYRGTWGSEGDFGFEHVVEDGVAVFDQIRDPAFAQAHRIDPQRVSLFGHSMGGFAVLRTGAERPAARCVVSLAGANFAALAAQLGDAGMRDRVAATFQGWGEGPIRGISGSALVEELLANTSAFDITRTAPALAGRPVMLIAGERDTVTPVALNHDPMVAALKAAGSTRLQELRYDADHAFLDVRIDLARAVTGFLDAECR